MGDDFTKWATYLSSLDPVAHGKDDPADIFEAWAKFNIADPLRREQCVASFQQVELGVVPQAILALNPAKNPTGFQSGVPVWTPLIADFNSQLPHGRPANVVVDSNTSSKDISKSWASGSAGFPWSFFSFGGGAKWSKSDTKVQTSNVKLSISIQRLLQVPPSPGSWFKPNLVSIALFTQDNTLWRAGASPNWNSVFGDNGSWKRNISSLWVADGIDCTVTVKATFLEDEQKQIQAQASFGFWPFWQASGGGASSSNKVTFDAQGMTVKWVNPLGNPLIIGATVVSTKDQFNKPMPN